MAKILSNFILFASLLFASYAFADNVSGYQSAKIGITPSMELAVPPTAINIINLSDERIYIDFPVRYEIPEGTGRSVMHNSYYGKTRIVLQDWHHRVFFDKAVCRYAIISVSGHPSSYYIKVDTERCN